MAFIWGLAEATFFFIVPDVFLTLIAVRNWRCALKATTFALAGSLIGGAMTFALGQASPERARSLLDHVPGISSQLMERVEAEMHNRGSVAVLLGPTKGIPYKLYAAEWGAQHRSLPALMLISIPARYVRFFVLVVCAALVAHVLKPLTKQRAPVEVALHAAFWIAFYSYYFIKFGW
jgi:membrane protein YqaA with SNARE-associated domain